MFGSLFLKECKAISKSIIYFVFIVVTILFYWSELAGNVENNIKNHNNPTSITEHSENPLVKPIPEQEYYGAKHAEVPEQIIPDTILTLLRETRDNSFSSYPFGFYKNVKLNNSELKKVKSIIQELTGVSYNDANQLLTKDVVDDETYLKSESEFREKIKNCCDYETFKENMLVIEKIIGKNSNYSYGFYKEKSVTNLSYEEALKEYNDFIEKDKVAGAYARLFCDYMGLVISLFSIFVTVSFLRRDRKSQINELIYSRKISSTKLISSRYLACVVMMILPVVILSFIPTVELVLYGIRNNISVNPFAYLSYITTWLVPTLMVTTSIGFLFTILTDTSIGIVIQLIWSFAIDIMGSMFSMEGGNCGRQLAIRFNTLGNYQAYKNNISDLFKNRMCYSLLAIVLLMITIFIYEQKRRGKLDAGAKLQKIFKHNKNSNKTIMQK